MAALFAWLADHSRVALTIAAFLLLVDVLLGIGALSCWRRLRAREREAAEREALAVWRAEQAHGALLAAVRLVRVARRISGGR